MSISVFLPTRKGSLRAPKKNTREFMGFKGGLLELKLKQLTRIEEADEIILSTNDERSLEIGQNFQKKYDKLRLEERPGHLASSETNLTDLIHYASGLANGNHLLWTHVTSPFCDEHIYGDVIREYRLQLQNNYDSLVGVEILQNFLWDKAKNDIINRIGNRRWPNTQDLKPLYEFNNAIFLAPTHFYRNNKDRLGTRPFLYEMDKITSLDIDDEEDYKIAEAVYERIHR